MDAIESVIELVKDRDDLSRQVDGYESWFDSLIGKLVTVIVRHKKKTHYVSAVVEEFTPGEGWMARGIEDDECLAITFDDFVAGDVWVDKVDVPKKSNEYQ